MLSQTNAAEAVGKDEYSIRDFLKSNAFKALLGAAPEFGTFAVENAQKPIIGIPPEIAEEYWFDQATKGIPLPRRVIKIGFGIEVFGLPGFELRRGRYLLSLTNAGEAVGKTHTSVVDFLASNALKALLGVAPELSIFVAENVQNGILGILPELANIYWAYQLSKSHLLPRRVIPIGSGIEVFGLPGFELKRGRYLLSLTNAGETVGRPARSIFAFLQSKVLKVSLGAGLEFSDFAVENAQKPITEVAFLLQK